MLDFGWPELIIIAAIAVFVIGPDDIPKIMYSVGRLFRRFQYMRYAVSQQFDDVLQSGDIDELRKGVNFEAKSDDNVDAENEADADEDISDEIAAQMNAIEPGENTLEDGEGEENDKRDPATT